MICEGKHTVYQPTDDEWRCPKCGADNSLFSIEESFGHDECPLLHTQDQITCFSCGHGTSGSRFAGAIQKRKNLVPCPCCKGRGVVSGKPNARAVTPGEKGEANE